MPRVARRKDTLAATRKIYRSDDTAIAGVCSGIAEGLDMDPATVRILAVLLVLATFGLFTLVYATLWLVLPKHVAISCRVTRMRPTARRARVSLKTILLVALALMAGRVRACGLAPRRLR